MLMSNFPSVQIKGNFGPFRKCSLLNACLQVMENPFSTYFFFFLKRRKFYMFPCIVK